MPASLQRTVSPDPVGNHDAIITGPMVATIDDLPVAYDFQIRYHIEVSPVGSDERGLAYNRRERNQKVHLRDSSATSV